LAAIGTDTQSFVSGVLQFDTGNYQYDTSDFDSLVGAIAHGFLSPDHVPAVSFLKANYFDNTLTDFSSIDKFIEDSWGLPGISGSFDQIAGSIDGLFKPRSTD
jgi:hypothetical protein